MKVFVFMNFAGVLIVPASLVVRDMAPVVYLANHLPSIGKHQDVIPLVFGKCQRVWILYFQGERRLKGSPRIIKVTAQISQQLGVRHAKALVDLFGHDIPLVVSNFDKAVTLLLGSNKLRPVLPVNPFIVLYLNTRVAPVILSFPIWITLRNRLPRVGFIADLHNIIPVDGSGIIGGIESFPNRRLYGVNTLHEAYVASHFIEYEGNATVFSFFNNISRITARIS